MANAGKLLSQRQAKKWGSVMPKIKEATHSVKNTDAKHESKKEIDALHSMSRVSAFHKKINAQNNISSNPIDELNMAKSLVVDDPVDTSPGDADTKDNADNQRDESVIVEVEDENVADENVADENVADENAVDETTPDTQAFLDGINDVPQNP